MSSKVITATLFVLSLLLFFSVTCRARAGPVFSNSDNRNPTTDKVGHGSINEAEDVMVEESCEGVGEEECLMRRTLAAHTDYIYTQKQKP
ncbi:Phytosulfokine [Parasponia andersonii]|uniref:Phytosulfokine n=1 Tax=Parasponia andersonii TaxID=3476 RepID=A0A2P5AVK8_PARAD|nr:Phytosulfokine [Parasponia andersonii]